MNFPMRLKASNNGYLLAIGGLALILVVPTLSSACSAVGCLGNGLATRRSFVVRITHDNKALAGVAVRVTSYGESGEQKAEHEVFSGITSGIGQVEIRDLAPGNYWLHAQLLGISAGEQCFHVNPHWSWKAKKEVKYEWGDLAPTVTEAAGTFIDSEPGQGGSIIWNFMHRVRTPVAGAKLRLQEPLTGNTYRTVSDRDGRFSFGQVPPATYVLNIDASDLERGAGYGLSGDMLVNVTEKTDKLKMLWLEYTPPGSGSCGGVGLRDHSN